MQGKYEVRKVARNWQESKQKSTKELSNQVLKKEHGTMQESAKKVGIELGSKGCTKRSKELVKKICKKQEGTCQKVVEKRSKELVNKVCKKSRKELAKKCSREEAMTEQ